MTHGRRVNYTGRPTPREKRKLPSDGTTIVFLLIVIAVLSFLLVRGVAQGQTGNVQAEQEHKITHDSLAPTYTYDGEIIRWYVFTDPDSSVQYLVNDRGGCTPRLDQYGNIIGVQTWHDE